MAWLHSLLGVLVLAALAWLFSENRREAHWQIAAVGVGLQLLLAGVMFHVPGFRALFLMLNDLALALGNATRAGTGFVFGYLGGGSLPFAETAPGGAFILAFQALPLVLVVSALSALLFHWGILPRVVAAFAWLLKRSMGVGGALGLGAAANIFIGMVEAPLLIRPYLNRLTRGELFALMTCGMATIAGTVMVLYATILNPVLPDAMGHILVASILSAPAALTVAMLMVPESAPATAGEAFPPSQDGSAMDAITRGTTEGVELLIQIVAMLVVLVSLVALVNQGLAVLPAWGGEAVTLERVLGYVMAPVCWVMGIPWSEAVTAGALMGKKTVLNELIAYLDLARLPADALSDRSRVIMTYALCGFANFGSLGIMIGGMGAMAPERRREIVGLGLRSILSGTLATCMTGAVVGVFVS